VSRDVFRYDLYARTRKKQARRAGDLLEALHGRVRHVLA
jgi:hypothetical protein